MATTFKALAKHADFVSPPAPSPNDQTEHLPLPDESDDLPRGTPDHTPIGTRSIGTPSIALRHDVHLHLPPTSDVAVYSAIFRALREELLD